MPLRYLVDENLRGTLAVTLVRVATKYGLSIDLLQVGDDPGPELGTVDSQLLMWAERHDRILVSRDRRTLAAHLAAHLATGHQSPGVLLVRDVPLVELAEYLVLLAFASDVEEWKDRICFVP
jgi:hypothetical protein